MLFPFPLVGAVVGATCFAFSQPFERMTLIKGTTSKWPWLSMGH